VLSCGSLLDLIEAGTLSHSDQQELNDGAVSAVKRDLAGGFAWDRAPGVTYLVAASLAAWGLLSASTPKPKHTPIPLTTSSDDRGRNDPHDLDFLSPGRTPF
jgi:hypothetical protein